MKTLEEIKKALEGCEKIRMAQRPRKSLCPMYPGSPICMDCTFTSAMEWVLDKYIDEGYKKDLRNEKISKECLKEVFEAGKSVYGQLINRIHLKIIKDLKLLYNHNWINRETIIRLFGQEGIDKCDTLIGAGRMEQKDGKYRIIISPAKRRKSMGAVSK